MGTGDRFKVAAMERQLKNEWRVILNAKGFGSRWASWILSLEVIPFVPLHLPDPDMLELCIDITERCIAIWCAVKSPKPDINLSAIARVC